MTNEEYNHDKVPTEHQICQDNGFILISSLQVDYWNLHLQHDTEVFTYWILKKPNNKNTEIDTRI